jgi:hypothetical protein
LIISKYFEVGELDAVCSSVKELSGNSRDLVVNKAIVFALERRERERAMVHPLIEKLVKENLIKKEKVNTRLTEVLLSVDDLRLDIPKVLDYVADVIAPFFCGDKPLISVDYLASDATSHLKETHMLADLTGMIFKTLVEVRVVPYMCLSQHV